MIKLVTIHDHDALLRSTGLTTIDPFPLVAIICHEGHAINSTVLLITRVGMKITLDVRYIWTNLSQRSQKFQTAVEAKTERKALKSLEMDEKLTLIGR